MSVLITARLEKSIQHEYDKKIEDYKIEELHRQKAEVVAKLFSKWLKYRGKEDEILSDKDLIDYYEELTKMSYEIALWIKDEKLLSEIMLRLTNNNQAKDKRVLIGEIRKLILNNKEDCFDSQEIVEWPNLEIQKKLFKL